MELRKITLSALYIAVGVALTKAFFLVGAGPFFLYIAVLFCALTLGPRYGLIVGILTPFTAFMVTGMLTPVLMFRIVPSLAVYGFVLGLYMKSGSCKNHCNTRIYTSIVLATLASRITAGVVTALFFGFGEDIFNVWIVFELIGALPMLIIDIFLTRMVMPVIRKVNCFKYLHATG